MISKDKSYKTRSGSTVRIYATDNTGPRPVHGAVLFHDGYWEMMSWSELGKYAWGGDHAFDLLEVDAPNKSQDEDEYVHEPSKGYSPFARLRFKKIFNQIQE